VERLQHLSDGGDSILGRLNEFVESLNLKCGSQAVAHRFGGSTCASTSWRNHRVDVMAEHRLECVYVNG
jgi:hypothetical protein